MKTYKDLDKSIVMNAPEGAMWVAVVGSNRAYYKYNEGKMYVYDTVEVASGSWELCHDHNLNDMLKGSWVKDLIPLPNIEIPWEATEDSVSPVLMELILLLKKRVAILTKLKQIPINLYWNTKPITGNQIVSYKIIDEEYLPKQDNTKEVEAPKVHTFTWQQPVTITLPDNPNQELIKNLEFLQILANKFPEIKDKVVELMEVELDAWWHGTLEEKTND